MKLKTVDDAQLDADQVNSDQVDVVQKNAAQVDAAPKEFTWYWQNATHWVLVVP